MNNIKELTDNPLSRRQFWRITGPLCAGITLLTIIIISWERLRWVYRRVRLARYNMRRERGIEAQLRNAQDLEESKVSSPDSRIVTTRP